MSRTRYGRLTFAAALALSAATADARAAPTCDFGEMQANPASVVGPCSKALDDPQLPGSSKAQDFYVRGRAYARTGQTELAAQDLDLAVKLAPDRSDVLVSRANAESKLGREEDAWQDLQRAVTLNPKEARAWFAIGQVYSHVGDVDQALSAYGTALASDPTEPYSLLNRSKILASRHRLAEALADATALVDIPPAVINKLGYIDGRGVMTDFHVVALNLLASLHEQEGDLAASDRDLESAIEERPTSSTYLQRGRSLLIRRRREEALRDAREAVRLDPVDGDAQYLLGLNLIGSHRFAEALDAFDSAIAAHKRVSVSWDQVGLDHLMRARSLRGLGRTDDAVASATRAVAVSPEEKAQVTASMRERGYLDAENASADADVRGAAFQAGLRACMTDEACN